VSRLSPQALFLLAVVLFVFVALSTGAGLGCEGSCDIATTVLSALWLPLIAAFLVVIVLLVSRLLERRD
jgi:ABC-type Na+ efflux pump permease subunit